MTDSGYSKRTITANGCPNHYSICTGKDVVTGCGGVGQEGTDSEANEQDKTVEIPGEPIIATSTTDVECDMGAIAIALNGVSIYSGAVDNQCTQVDVEDSTSEWSGFDFCSGHAEMTGDYHYHFPPSCLLDQAATATGANASSHSPQIGWAYDGFPIYGPLGPGGVTMTHTAAGCAGDYCLDSCSGQEATRPAIDSFKYRYYMSGATSDLVSLPTDPKPAADDYPYTLKCYVGCTWDDLSSGASKCSGGATGVADGYAASALAGYTDKYVSSAASALMCSSASDTSYSNSVSGATACDAAVALVAAAAATAAAALTLL